MWHYPRGGHAQITKKAPLSLKLVYRLPGPRTPNFTPDSNKLDSGLSKDIHWSSLGQLAQKWQVVKVWSVNQASVFQGFIYTPLKKYPDNRDFRSRFFKRLVDLSTEGLILQKMCVSIN